MGWIVHMGSWIILIDFFTNINEFEVKNVYECVCLSDFVIGLFHFFYKYSL